MNGLLFLIRHRRMLKATVKDTVRRRYAGHLLGATWLVLYPLLFLSVYAVVYMQIFRIRFPGFGSGDYVLLMFCGLIPALGVSESIGMGVSAVASHPSLVRNTMFPVELLPVRNVLAGQASQAVSTGLLLLALLVKGKLGLSLCLLPLAWSCQILFLCGMAWLLAALHVFIRDIQQGVQLSLFLLIMLAPVAYTAEMVPAHLRNLLAFNPLWHLVMAWQDILMLDRSPSPLSWLILAGGGSLTFLIGFKVFQRLKPAFADFV